jgi:predicted nucleic acid-binding protein
MNPVVLDTDVVSFLFKNDRRGQAYLPHLRDRQWLISFMTEAELEQWALLSNWPAKRTEWLRVFLAGPDGGWRLRMRGSQQRPRCMLLL